MFDVDGLMIYENPVTTKSHVTDLHHLLVQTCLEFMKKHNLTDIEEVHFSADGLQDGLKYMEWTPGIDSSLDVIGYQNDKDDGYPQRCRIGFSM